MDAAPSVGVLAEPLLARLCRKGAAEPFLVATVALLALLSAAATTFSLVDDSWMTLVYGREVARGGLPHADTVTLVAHGRSWVDQQWLAQLAFYGAWSVAGLRGALVLAAAAVEAALAAGIVAARRSGASAAAAAAGALLAVLATPWIFQLRAQTLVLPLFVLLFALLAADARAPTPRVLLALPLLAVWANLHGSVLLAAALVVLRGLGRALRLRRLARAERLRTAALVVGAPAAVLCTPYGAAVLGYYRAILVRPDFAQYVVEWQRTQLGPLTLGFFGLGALVAYRAGRFPGRLTGFERLALVVLAAAALDARRNTVWFALAALLTLPRLLSLAGPAVAPAARDRRVQLGLAALAAAAAAAIALAGPAPPGPGRVGDAVAVVAARDPSARIFPEEPWADWLLWRHPELAGRIAWDSRFELLRPEEIHALADLRTGTPTPLTRGYRLFLVDPNGWPGERRPLLRRGGRVVARDGQLEAILLPRA